MKYPLVTVIIATFNSEKTLPMVLESVRGQTYPKDKIEILVVDGGSTDKTLTIGKEFNCRIINNPRTEPLYGKYLGYLNAKGKYAIYLDHDEVSTNKDSIKLKLEAFKGDRKIKAVIGSGYKSPKGYPFINNYINEFGDPFSFFIYRLSKDSNFFIPTMKKRYPIISETKDFLVFGLSRIKTLPIIELAAGGSMFDIKFLKKEFPETTERIELLPHFFYLLHLLGYSYIAITKDDTLIHYSADALKKYLCKIQWRVKNNIYHVSDMGASGFTGRDKFQPFWAQFKKYFFIPYSYSIIFPLIDSLLLATSRKKLLYLLHVPLCLYTATLIIYHYCLKILGKKPKLKSYGGSKEIN